jgi:hypothetical protein
MVRKSTLIIVMTISVFMMYGGCDGDGESMMDEAPPGAEAPAGQSHACEVCPCKFYDGVDELPMTEACWGSEVGFHPRPRRPFPAFCELSTARNNAFTHILIQFFPSHQQWMCIYSSRIPDADCGNVDGPIHKEITFSEAAACIACLEQYTSALSESESGPHVCCEPYNCNIQAPDDPVEPY